MKQMMNSEEIYVKNTSEMGLEIWDGGFGWGRKSADPHMHFITAYFLFP